MKYVIGILVLLALISSCTDDVSLNCDGFTSEPTLSIQINTSDSFGIAFYNSRGKGDTAFASANEQLLLPIDMNDSAMSYELLIDTSVGKFSLTYAFTQILCPHTDELNLHFSEAHFHGDAIANRLFAIENNVATAIDTNSGYSNFLNKTLSTRFIEIRL